jgi:hypothetical protein
VFALLGFDFAHAPAVRFYGQDHLYRSREGGADFVAVAVKKRGNPNHRGSIIAAEPGVVPDQAESAGGRSAHEAGFLIAGGGACQGVDRVAVLPEHFIGAV